MGPHVKLGVAKTTANPRPRSVVYLRASARIKGLSPGETLTATTPFFEK